MAYLPGSGKDMFTKKHVKCLAEATDNDYRAYNKKMAMNLRGVTKIGTRQEGWWTPDTYQPLHISTRQEQALVSTPDIYKQTLSWCLTTR